MLANLQAAEFIYEQPAFPENEYTFKHALTQEVAYDSVLMQRRRIIHERTATALEETFAATLDDHLAELAHHYSRSANASKAVEYLTPRGGASGDPIGIQRRDWLCARGVARDRDDARIARARSYGAEDPDDAGAADRIDAGAFVAGGLGHDRARAGTLPPRRRDARDIRRDVCAVELQARQRTVAGEPGYRGAVARDGGTRGQRSGDGVGAQRVGGDAALDGRIHRGARELRASDQNFRPRHSALPADDERAGDSVAVQCRVGISYRRPPGAGETAAGRGRRAGRRSCAGPSASRLSICTRSC